MNEVLTGLNPKADDRFAAALGVKIKPEDQDEVDTSDFAGPPVKLGNRGYETDASGKAIEVKSPLIDEVLGHYTKLSGTGRADFRLGLLYAASFLVALSDHNYEVSGKLQNEATRLRGID